MSDAIADVFSDRQYCIDEMLRIHDTWGSRSKFTREAIEAARISLGFMALYCPDDLRDMVMATIDELGRRELYVLAGDRA